MSPHMLLLGIVFLVLGYLIGVKKKVGLLAGFNQHRVKDKDKLAQLVGGYNLVIGTLMVLASFIDNPNAEAIIPLAVLGFFILLGYVQTRMVE
ncbi:DUF3784 domain-containing protein [Paenibacillus spongiae]|uniref:DUF3784 domain-containing protein n=1 Tax=Paenibacillus spongiae TaxID=2909671 RepID=A0ABY5S854_9BACL|nr:DUF3784 domain-containing protein [Paenibacillus spongiae]UVI28513.1 DUF3784 domain-containing protein [Paenibacillus spongiae]